MGGDPLSEVLPSLPVVVNIPDYSGWLSAFASNSDYYRLLVVFLLAVLVGVMMFRE